MGQFQGLAPPDQSMSYRSHGPKPWPKRDVEPAAPLAKSRWQTPHRVGTGCRLGPGIRRVAGSPGPESTGHSRIGILAGPQVLRAIPRPSPNRCQWSGKCSGDPKLAWRRTSAIVVPLAIPQYICRSLLPRPRPESRNPRKFFVPAVCSPLIFLFRLSQIPKVIPKNATRDGQDCHDFQGKANGQIAIQQIG